MTNRVVLFSILSAAMACAADTRICPDSIAVRPQQLATPVSGWDSMTDPAPVQLSGITFFDGPPEQQASLVYDKIVKAAGKEVASWTFGPQSKTWLTCHYSGTNVVLKKMLPAKTSSCTVTYNPKETIAGLPVIEKLSCK